MMVVHELGIFGQFLGKNHTRKIDEIEKDF